MSFTQWLRQVFGLGVQVAHTSRRGKTRQPSRRRHVPSLEILEDRLAPATLTVNTKDDNASDTSVLTLREAVTLVNNGGNSNSLGQSSMPAGWASQITGAFGANDMIEFASSLGGDTITLSQVGDNTAGPSALAVTTKMSIDGLTGNSGVTLGGGGGMRLFFISSSGSLTLQDLTLKNGVAKGGNGGQGSGGGGGGRGRWARRCDLQRAGLADDPQQHSDRQHRPGGQRLKLTACQTVFS